MCGEPTPTTRQSMGTRPSKGVTRCGSWSLPGNFDGPRRTQRHNGTPQKLKNNMVKVCDSPRFLNGGGRTLSCEPTSQAQTFFFDFYSSCYSSRRPSAPCSYPTEIGCAQVLRPACFRNSKFIFNFDSTLGYPGEGPPKSNLLDMKHSDQVDSKKRGPQKVRSEKVPTDIYDELMATQSPAFVEPMDSDKKISFSEKKQLQDDLNELQLAIDPPDVTIDQAEQEYAAKFENFASQLTTLSPAAVEKLAKGTFKDKSQRPKGSGKGDSKTKALKASIHESEQRALGQQECRNFSKFGKCKFGDKCKYFHSPIIEKSIEESSFEPLPKAPKPPEPPASQSPKNLGATFLLPTMSTLFGCQAWKSITWTKIKDIDSKSEDNRVLPHRPIDVVYKNPQLALYTYTQSTVIYAPTLWSLTKITCSQILNFIAWRVVDKYILPCAVNILSPHVSNVSNALISGFSSMSNVIFKSAFTFLATPSAALKSLVFDNVVSSSLAESSSVGNSTTPTFPISTIFTGAVFLFLSYRHFTSTWNYYSGKQRGRKIEFPNHDPPVEKIISEELTIQLLHANVSAATPVDTFATIIDRLAQNYAQINLDRTQVMAKNDSKLYAKQFHQHLILDNCENSSFHQPPQQTLGYTSTDTIHLKRLEQAVFQSNLAPATETSVLIDAMSENLYPPLWDAVLWGRRILSRT